MKTKKTFYKKLKEVKFYFGFGIGFFKDKKIVETPIINYDSNMNIELIIIILPFIVIQLTNFYYLPKV